MVSFAAIDTGENDVLRQAVVETVSMTTCQSLWGWSVITYNMQCAGTEDGKGICFGDSGGPLVCKQGGRWLQYGISSFVYKYNCVRSSNPNVFANVANLLPWIQKKTGSQYMHSYRLLYLCEILITFRPQCLVEGSA